MASSGHKDERMGKAIVVLTACIFGGMAFRAKASSEVTYFYTDAQGTVLAVTDTQGNLKSTNDYKPFGTIVLGELQPQPGYAGHLPDPDSGLSYMQARYYDPSTGRFLSIDPTAAKAGDISRMNRYTYANNNPITNFDPDGRDCRTTNGMTNCVTAAYDISFRAQPKFVDFTAASQNYHFYSVPVEAEGVSLPEAREQLVSNPTPGFSNGATPDGTRNDATPLIGNFLTKTTSPVMSFTVTNQKDGQPAVVNVTLDGHELASGIVVREAVQTPAGGTLIQTWGEGTAGLQAPGTLSGQVINSIWNIEAPSPSSKATCGQGWGTSCLQ